MPTGVVAYYFYIQKLFGWDPKREIDRAGRVMDPRIDRLDLGLETLARGPGVVVMLFQSFVVHIPFKKKPGAERPYGIAAIAAGSDGRAAPGAGSGPYSAEIDQSLSIPPSATKRSRSACDIASISFIVFVFSLRHAANSASTRAALAWRCSRRLLWRDGVVGGNLTHTSWLFKQYHADRFYSARVTYELVERPSIESERMDY